jgi:hypothetical protein
MKNTMEQAERRVAEALLGESIEEMHLAYLWKMRFTNDLWVLASDVSSDRQNRIDELLRQHERDLLTRSDSEDVTKALLLVSFMRRPVTNCKIDESGSLALDFGGEGRTLNFPANVEVVDWQWCLGSSDADPYSAKAIVACLAPGVIEVDGH